MTHLSSDIIGSNVKHAGSDNVCFAKLDRGATRVSGGQFSRSAFVIPFSAEVNPSFTCHVSQFALVETLVRVL